ncbi:MAG TPA: DUF5668 domain-containing protein [Thermoanaerobaculaceae bacterium]|nr:DUF5668 domain-containing protein [Thermoanaerobaculaceae bacterium]HPS80194.1 DUF5668 domain-containing protein [Thermoanaerobaculaceae bacterium]
MARTRSKHLFLALVLIAVGGVLLATRFFPLDWTPALVLGLGIAFAGMAILQRSQGTLVTGMILLGLGAGMALGRAATLGIPVSNWMLLCLAGAFFAIFVFGALLGTSRHWWPLIPGVVLLVVGGAQYASRLNFFPPALESAARTWWPAALVLAGAILLFKAFRK